MSRCNTVYNEQLPVYSNIVYNEQVPVYSDAVELVGDIVELELEQDTAVAQAKLNLIQEADAAEAPLAMRAGDIGASGHLLSCLQVAYCRAEEVGQFEDTYDDKVGHYTLQPVHVSAERKAALYTSALKKAVLLCEDELQRMPTSLQDDQNAMASLKGICVHIVKDAMAFVYI